jgi:hypothetical protein
MLERWKKKKPEISITFGFKANIQAYNQIGLSAPMVAGLTAERRRQDSTRRAGEAHNARSWRRSYLKGCPMAAAEWENSAPGYFLTKE